MNCQEFQNHFNDPDHRASTDVAQAHAQSCSTCREYAREQSLTNCLRHFAASTAACQSSPAVETALRQAFRQHAASQNTAHDTAHNALPSLAVAAPMPVFEDVRSEANAAQSSSEQVGINHLIHAQTANVWGFNRGVFASVIIAAVCLATFGTFAARWQTSERANNETAFINPTSSPLSTSQTFAARQTASPETAGSPSSLGFAGVARANDAPAYIQNTRFTAPRRTATPRPKTNDRTMRASKPVAPENQTENEQVATQFFPLDDGLSLPVESGHLMKIEMPRSALASFGLPTTVERANEVVKAEVLVGTDGIARAIRFVR